MVYTRPAAPEPLDVVETFCNSARFLHAEDAFAELASAQQWMRHQEGADAAALTDIQRRELIRIREAVRDHLDDQPSADKDLTDAASALLSPPRWSGGLPSLVPSHDHGWQRLLATVLATLATEETAGRRGRLKVCRAPECRWVFYDRSPGNNSVWCSMNICGARHKMRSYRTRRGGPTPP